MLTLKIEASGASAEDLETILDRIRDQVLDGYTSGFDRNESGNYNYSVDGTDESEADLDDDEESDSAHLDCYYAEPTICQGSMWECGSCGNTYCQAHSHTTDLGTNVECVACERSRKETESVYSDETEPK